MTCIDLAALAATPLQHEPYDYLIVPDFIRPDSFGAVSQDFPDVPGPGSHPPSELKIAGAFKTLMEELEGAAFRKAIEDKFAIDLTGRPTMYTVRGFVRARDGGAHTDSKTKLITVLIYMNEGWEADGGRLRILRGPDALDDPVAEAPPYGGALLAFRRSANSWHGHLPHEGPRRAIQLNWVTNQSVVEREQGRHRLATRMKKLRDAVLGRAG